MNLQRFACTESSSLRPAEIPTVFLVDADPSARETLEAWIVAAGLRCESAASAQALFERPLAMTPSCLLVDLNLPGIGGVELQRLVFERTELPVIFMSNRPDVRATVQAMKAGAFDFLIKPVGNDMLLRAIHEAIERCRAEMRHRAAIQALESRYESLSRRER
jgi:FixJ family two-component response regulator